MNFSKADISNLDDRYRRNLINSFTGFKSLHLIGTRSISGEENVAVFSQVIHVGANPPYIGVLFRPNTVARHTFKNILDTGWFSLNHVKEGIVSAAHQTSARYKDSEFTATNLTPFYVDPYNVPLVKESSIQAICELNERIDIKSNGTHLIIGSIEKLFVPEDIIESDGYIDVEKGGSLTVSGLDTYHKTKKIAKFKYAKPYQQTEILE